MRHNSEREHVKGYWVYIFNPYEAYGGTNQESSQVTKVCLADQPFHARHRGVVDPHVFFVRPVEVHNAKLGGNGGVVPMACWRVVTLSTKL